MKVIDLLNKIANGEEVPKKIKYDETLWEFRHGVDYMNSNNKFLLETCICLCRNDLNAEVEIIEEPQEHKIPEKLNIPEMSCRKKWKRDIDVWEKINEILDYLEVNNG